MRARLNIIVGAVFMLLIIGVLVIGSNPQRVRKMQSGFLGIISPFLRSGSNIDRKVKDFRKGMMTLEQLEAEVKLLRESNSRLLAEKRDVDELQKNIDRLQAAVGFRKSSRWELVPARIIVRDASTWYNAVTVDRGTADGITPDMAVITEAGLVGKTDVVSEHDCTVRLVADEQCKVAARFESTGEQGIVKGERISSSIAPTISLNYITKETVEKKKRTVATLESRKKELDSLDEEAATAAAKESAKEELNPDERAILVRLRRVQGEVAAIEKELELITSGVGGVFPPGLRIGRTKEFKVLELDGYAVIDAAVDLTTLEDVFIVKDASERAEAVTPADKAAKPPR